MKARRRARRGETLVDWLLVATVAAVAVVAAAYVWMPDVQRGLATLVDRAEARFLAE